MAILIEIYQQFISTLPNAIIQTLNGAVWANSNSSKPDIQYIYAIYYFINEFLRQKIPTWIYLSSESSQSWRSSTRTCSRSSRTSSRHRVRVDLKIVFVFFSSANAIKITFHVYMYIQIASSSIQEVTFHTAVKSVCAPMMKCLFSGYLNMGPLMFVWDQYVISSDVPGFHDELIPTMAAIILMVLRDQLVSAHSVSSFNIPKWISWLILSCLCKCTSTHTFYLRSPSWTFVSRVRRFTSRRVRFRRSSTSTSSRISRPDWTRRRAASDLSSIRPLVISDHGSIGIKV